MKILKHNYDGHIFFIGCGFICFAVGSFLFLVSPPLLILSFVGMVLIGFSKE